MKRVIPNKLTAREQSTIFGPATAALIALRMGRADVEHYHNLAGAMLICNHAIELVARHRHLADEIKPAFDALNSIFERAKQRTVEDAPWSGTAEEIDAIESGVEIYKAVVRTTPGPVLRRAILRAQAEAQA